MTAMLYEAVAPEKPICLYSHHGLEFPVNLEYLEELRHRGFAIKIVNPFLEYFDLMERGIGFLTRKDPWCVPMLVGTGIIEWLQEQGARSPREAVMFRGMSGSEYSHKFHTKLELYRRLDLPTFNPLLSLFGSGLIEKAHLRPEHRTVEEKLHRHGFVHWNRIRAQNVVGAVKRRPHAGILVYRIRELHWIDTKHLAPLKGNCRVQGNEVRFWKVDEKKSDAIIKRMMNCLNCGFCVVECFRGRHFDRKSKVLRIEHCVQCGRCLRVKFCMGWKHRFWRRIIVEESSHGN